MGRKLLLSFVAFSFALIALTGQVFASVQYNEENIDVDVADFTAVSTLTCDSSHLYATLTLNMTENAPMNSTAYTGFLLTNSAGNESFSLKTYSTGLVCVFDNSSDATVYTNTVSLTIVGNETIEMVVDANGNLTIQVDNDEVLDVYYGLGADSDAVVTVDTLDVYTDADFGCALHYVDLVVYESVADYTGLALVDMLPLAVTVIVMGAVVGMLNKSMRRR